jgi:hypothetical protein
MNKLRTKRIMFVKAMILNLFFIELSFENQVNQDKITHQSSFQPHKYSAKVSKKGLSSLFFKMIF